MNLRKIQFHEVKNKRLKIIVFALIMWFILGILGILHDSDMLGLASYFTSGAFALIGYLYTETKRPSGFVETANGNGGKNFKAIDET